MSTSKPMFGPVVLEITYMIYSTFSMNIVCNFSMTRILKDSTESKDACLVFSLEHQSLSTFKLNLDYLVSHNIATQVWDL